MIGVELYHGPAAREAAVNRANDVGRMLADPFGDGGLKVADAREIVELLSCPPVGDRAGSVVIGPMDSATPEAADSLLKVLEEVNTTILIPVLWADDAGSVIGTIRSRSSEVWCPTPPGTPGPDTPYLATAETLCESALRRRVAAVIETLADNKGQERELLRAAASVLATKEEWPLDARLKLWALIRPFVGLRSVTPRQALAALLV